MTPANESGTVPRSLQAKNGSFALQLPPHRLLRFVMGSFALRPDSMQPLREAVYKLQVLAILLIGMETDPPTTSFRTAKGSIYIVHADGTTTRNKSFQAGHGGNDVGWKKRSEMTVYGGSNVALVLSAAGIENLGLNGARLILHDCRAALLTWSEKAGRWGILPSSRGILFTTTLEIGKSPVEGWDRRDDVPGYSTAFAIQHAGNPITEMYGPSV